MITYKIKSATNIQVRLDGKVVGSIIQSGTGFQYVPKGVKKEKGGEIFPTIRQVKDSIEAE